MLYKNILYIYFMDGDCKNDDEIDDLPIMKNIEIHECY